MPSERRARRARAAGCCDACAGGVLAEELGVVAARRTAARARAASISRATLPRSRPRDVAGDVDAARGAFALDLVRRRARSRRRRRRRAARAPPAGVSISSSRSAATVARAPRGTPQTATSKIFCSSIDLADLRALHERRRRRGGRAPGVRPKRAAASGRRRTCDLRHEHLRLDLQVGDAVARRSITPADLRAPSRAARRGRGRRCARRCWRSRR